MAQEIFQVDAFTDKPFTGNPAGVCILPGPADEEWMQIYFDFQKVLLLTG